MKKYNQQYIKARNKGRILKLLIEKGPMSRAAISKELDIVRSTVSESVNELIKINVIEEGKKVSGNIGKRPTLMYFNKNLYYFVAVVISPYGINIALVNLSGDIINEDLLEYPDNYNAEDILGSAVKRIKEMLDNIPINLEDIAFISLGSPETISKKTGKIRWAPYIKDWVGVDLKSFFENVFKVDVILKDHVKLETLGEQWRSFNNISNMIYLVITKGIGAGVVIDGKIREGYNGYLGEIAFLPLAEKIDYQAIANHDKNLGYFESKCDIIKIRNIVETYSRENNLKINAEDFSTVANLYNNDFKIRELINESIIKTMALGIAAMIIIMDPEIVVINGEIIDFGEDFLELLKAEVYKLIPFKRQILFSKLKEKSGLYGAVKNGLDWIDLNISNNPDLFFSRIGKTKI
ncbi:MAG: ROK family transcriptional regulator [Actinobacteria bacterium]|nr:ROK family transcriptional regulator [Actinomycetota bacterium]